MFSYRKTFSASLFLSFAVMLSTAGSVHADQYEYSLPWALEFDGESARVEVGDNPGFHLETFSVGAWFRAPAGSGNRTILHRGPGWADNNWLIQLNPQGRLVASARDSDSSGSVFSLETDGSYDDGQWHMVYLVVDSTQNPKTAQLYVDGELRDSATFTETIAAKPHPVNIGADRQGSRYHFPWRGSIREVRIYSRPLSENRIQEIYEGIPVEESLIGHWAFDEGQGETAHDSTDGERHAGIIGAEWSRAVIMPDILTLPAETVLPALKAASRRDPSISVRRQAVRALGALDADPGYVAAVLQEILKDSQENDSVRLEAFAVLEKADPELRELVIGYQGVNEALRRAAHDSGIGSHLRLSAIEMHPESEGFESVLVELLEDGDVRERAAGLLIGIGPGAVPALLEGLKNDPGEEKRLLSVELLGRLDAEGRHATPVLTDIFKDMKETGAVRSAALNILYTGGPGMIAHLGNDPDALEILRKASLPHAPHPTLRQAACRALKLLDMDIPDEADDWPMWRYDAGRSAASPHQLPESPQLRWTRDLPDPQPAWPWEPRKGFDAVYKPVVAGGTLFVGLHTDKLIALDTLTGEERWSFRTDGPIRPAPAYRDGRVVFGSDDGHLYCLDARSGELLWKFMSAPAARTTLGTSMSWPFITASTCSVDIASSAADAGLRRSVERWPRSAPPAPGDPASLMSMSFEPFHAPPRRGVSQAPSYRPRHRRTAPFACMAHPPAVKPSQHIPQPLSKRDAHVRRPARPAHRNPQQHRPGRLPQARLHRAGGRAGCAILRTRRVARHQDAQRAQGLAPR